MADKRFYWLKLKTDFYEDDGPADFLMSQKDGANYVVIYQMLCLKTINSKGRLENQIGDYLIRYDIDKIQRIVKYFSIDTVRTALGLYKALGLVYEENDGTLVIADYGSLVGSETGAAERKRRQRLRENEQKKLTDFKNYAEKGEDGGDSERDIVCDERRDNVTTEIEYRDKEIDKEIDKDKEDVFPKKKKDEEEFHKHGEYGWVKLTDKQYQKLEKDMGQQELERCIQYVDESAQGNHNRNGWTDWNLVVRKCHREGWGIGRGYRSWGAENGQRVEREGNRGQVRGYHADTPKCAKEYDVHIDIGGDS